MDLGKNGRPPTPPRVAPRLQAEVKNKGIKPNKKKKKEKGKKK